MCKNESVTSKFLFFIKTLAHDYQVIAEDVMQMLEEIEKESDIDEILSYRFVAERELQVTVMHRIALRSIHCQFSSACKF